MLIPDQQLLSSGLRMIVEILREIGPDTVAILVSYPRIIMATMRQIDRLDNYLVEILGIPESDIKRVYALYAYDAYEVILWNRRWFYVTGLELARRERIPSALCELSKRRGARYSRRYR